jgi:carboxyl-terminal processing protease
VNVASLMNGALDGLRNTLSQAGVKTDLQPIPASSNFWQAQTLFRTRFDAAGAAAEGRVTKTALAYAAIQSMTGTLRDSHTGFISPEQNRERQARQRGQAAFSGIGVVLLPRDGRLYVRDVIPGGPAAAAGMRPLDRIVRINGAPIGGMSIDQVAGMIRGPAGTTVAVTIDRGPGPTEETLSLVRRPIQVPAIFQAKVLDAGIGYLQLYQFVNRTGGEFKAAVDRMLAGGMRALVLDVRANHGGYLHELTAVLDTLLPSGKPVYRETTRNGLMRTVRTSDTPRLPANVPVIVLMDEGSASAAELLSAALQEHHRATLVGERTSGAVEASVLIDLSDGSALSVTVQRLSTGLGKRLEGTGVSPDVAVAQATSDLEKGRDTQLLRGIAIARQRLGLADARPRSPGEVFTLR